MAEVEEVLERKSKTCVERLGLCAALGTSKHLSGGWAVEWCFSVEVPSGRVQEGVQACELRMYLGAFAS